jgi:hypothetical protein
MRFIYSVFFTLVITIPLYSQIDSASKIDVTKIKINQLDKDRRTPQHLEYLDKKVQGLPNTLPQNTDKFNIIPLPPATKENSKFELLPLSKLENFVVRLLKGNNK